MFDRIPSTKICNECTCNTRLDDHAGLCQKCRVSQYRANPPPFEADRPEELIQYSLPSPPSKSGWLFACHFSISVGVVPITTHLVDISGCTSNILSPPGNCHSAGAARRFFRFPLRRGKDGAPLVMKFVIAGVSKVTISFANSSVMSSAATCLWRHPECTPRPKIKL
jgi:hypothetical protein